MDLLTLPSRGDKLSAMDTNKSVSDISNYQKNPKILYAGDTTLQTAASYLAGILTHYEFDFDYVASDEPIGPKLTADYGLYIISDFPVNNWNEDDFAQVLDNVRAGAGLLMIGGWESFHGLAGEYHNSPLAQALPVTMQDSDDRVNSPDPCLIEVLVKHEIIDGLPFDRPPAIGGYNRITPKSDATKILALRPVQIASPGAGKYDFTLGQAEPLLVLGNFDAGRTAAFASDVAPHWVGTFVDWGPDRIRAQAEDAEGVEVGNHYAEFFARLVKWAMNM